MFEPSVFAVVGLLACVAVLLAALFRRVAKLDLAPLFARLDTLEKFHERGERTFTDAVERSRQDAMQHARGLREEVQNTLMGFRTLAIQQRSSEVWNVLGAVKAEFGKFGDTLEKVKRKLDETGTTIEEAAHRSRQLERKLKDVESPPTAKPDPLNGECISGEATSITS